MNYKLLALDLDGTLLDKNNNITDKTKNVLHKLKQNGLKIVIATGRMFCSALPYVTRLNLNGPVITYNGAYVKDTESEKVLLHKPVAIDLAQEIINDCQKHNLHLNLYQKDTLYVAQSNKLSQGYEKASGVTAREVGSLADFVSEDPTKLLAIENNRDKQQRYLNLFKKKYRGQLEVSESKSNYIEFMSRGVSKGQALKFVAEKNFIKQKEVIAIGDSWNDLSMLEWAGIGVAVETAAPEIKSRVDLVAPPPESDGIASVLEQIFN